MSTGEAVHRERRLYLDAKGDLYPIITWLHADGDETSDPALAVFAVAGSNHRWFSIDLEQFQTASVN